MGRKNRITEERIQAVQEYLSGQGSYQSIGRKYGITVTTLRDFVCRVRSEGIDAIRLERKNRKYSSETKRAAVEEYLDGKGSQKEICSKYKIKDRKTLRSWIMWYNGHKEFKERSTAKGEIYMTKGRKTTQEERAEIVAFCIEHNKDYGLTVETYKVSYQQIYSWARKYEEGGVNKLKDNRGRTKPAEEMSEVDKLKAEMKILEVKNRQLEIENAFIKKLQELKGGGH